MCRKLWLILPFGVLLAVVSFLTQQARPIDYAALQPAKNDLVAAGYYCTSDRKDGQLDFGFLVTRELTDWRDVGGMLKIGSRDADWQGKVWVTRIGTRFQLQTTLDGGASRVWGKIIAFGDPVFLNEIERNLRRVS